MNPQIMIGCPVRNRAWILPRYLKALAELEYPVQSLQYTFIINDCNDATPSILLNFAQRYPGRVQLIFRDLGVRSSRQHQRGGYNFEHLAYLRNLLIQVLLFSQCQYLFSVDSDILVPPDSLSRLLQDDCDVVSALVCNGHQLGDPNLFNILTNINGSWKHLRDFPRDRVFPVDCTGAAYLIKRVVLERYKVRYSARWGAEDIGFCQNAKEKGIKIFCDGRLESIHIMDEEIIITEKNK